MNFKMILISALLVIACATWRTEGAPVEEDNFEDDETDEYDGEAVAEDSNSNVKGTVYCDKAKKCRVEIDIDRLAGVIIAKIQLHQQKLCLTDRVSNNVADSVDNNSYN